MLEVASGGWDGGRQQPPHLLELYTRTESSRSATANLLVCGCQAKARTVQPVLRGRTGQGERWQRPHSPAATTPQRLEANKGSSQKVTAEINPTLPFRRSAGSLSLLNSRFWQLFAGPAKELVNEQAAAVVWGNFPCPGYIRCCFYMRTAPGARSASCQSTQTEQRRTFPQPPLTGSTENRADPLLQAGPCLPRGQRAHSSGLTSRPPGRRQRSCLRWSASGRGADGEKS